MLGAVRQRTAVIVPRLQVGPQRGYGKNVDDATDRFPARSMSLGRGAKWTKTVEKGRPVRETQRPEPGRVSDGQRFPGRAFSLGGSRQSIPQTWDGKFNSPGDPASDACHRAAESDEIEIQTLESALTAAVQATDYEEAARLKKKIQMLRTSGAPAAKTFPPRTMSQAVAAKRRQEQRDGEEVAKSPFPARQGSCWKGTPSGAESAQAAKSRFPERSMSMSQAVHAKNSHAREDQGDIQGGREFPARAMSMGQGSRWTRSVSGVERTSAFPKRQGSYKGNKLEETSK